MTLFTAGVERAECVRVFNEQPRFHCVFEGGKENK